ncbi:interleukin-1 receptor antagonist protein-like isoform X1 [Tachyglossus aculeatus]|uniref:interleukin-1 receptor antagonist protein-like isoform X1 n=1 Tax=Tachyglossus aculeatus TaxID=9261 RepID=UPI0018F45B22|nr:interleukin-1 receptor antagonist protein-like isoform X1 [Tachyglossus aculeatus]
MQGKRPVYSYPCPNPRLVGLQHHLLFRIWDVSQKTFYLRNNQLVAGYLQASNMALEEKIDVVPISPFNNTMFMGIQGGSRCLACVKPGNQPVLQLEEINIADLARAGDQAKRFAFIKSHPGPTFRFESAAYPGWFLCTSQEDQPVGLTNHTQDPITTDFYFEKD